MKKPHLTVAIPTHDMPNKVYFLERLFDSLWNQSFQDFEIVVTDNSDDDVIREVCEWYRTGIRYIRNSIKGMAPNTNEAIVQSKGDYIKILYMDDYLLHDEVLEKTMKKIGDSGWLIAGADNNSSPYWTEDIHTGNNKLGSPSALTVKNDKPLLFDESLTWLLDCDLYKRLHKRYGEPVTMHGKHIGIGIGPHQMTYTISHERRVQESDYLMKKYA